MTADRGQAATELVTFSEDDYPWSATMPRDYEKDALTPADWVGPDGVIYPNWTWAGVHIGEPGKRKWGIPERSDVCEKLAPSGKPQGKAFTKALVAAVEKCGKNGGGVIEIPEGTYTLTRPLLIQHDGIVLRGAGRGEALEPGGRDDPKETRIVFNFAYGVDGEPAVKLLSFPDNSHLYENSVLGFYAQAFSPKSSFRSQQGGGKKSHINRFEITITPHGKKPVTLGIVSNWHMRDQYDLHESFRASGPTTVASLKASKLKDLLQGVSRVTFQMRVVWNWDDEKGDKQVDMEDSAVGKPITLDCSDFANPPEDHAYHLNSALTDAIVFLGGPSAGKTYFTRDAKRGDTDIYVDMKSDTDPKKAGIYPGAAVKMFTYDSDAWAAAIERDGDKGVERNFMATVLDVARVPNNKDELKVTIEQPLQIGFPENEGNVDTWDPKKGGYVRTGTKSSWLSGQDMIEEVGVENIVLEQEPRIWFNGITMLDAMNSWVKNVRVERAGRNPVNLVGLMNELRDAELIDPIWANAGGGSAYLSGSTHTLITNVYGRNMRHAPNFAGHTAGVFHDCRFFSSDLQWHMHWGRAHLIDNCTVDALKGTGSYGYAAYAQRNTADIHGPGMGPRNVIYNSDLTGPSGGIFLGGKTENPMVLHTRVRAWTGPGLILRYHVFNGLFLGNVFAVQNRFEPGVLFGDVDPEHSRLSKTQERPDPPIDPTLGAKNPGNDFIGNTIYGGDGKIADGSWRFDHIRSKWRASYGNKVRPWDANPPRPKPVMKSVFEMQRAHPGGFADKPRDEVLYQPRKGTPANSYRRDGKPVAFVNFRDTQGSNAGAPEHWHGDSPGKGWFSDLGEPFGEHTKNGKALSYGWVGGEPQMRQQAWWSDPDFRYRTIANWGHWKGEDLTPYGQWEEEKKMSWQIALPPGTYRVFLAAGSPRKPERTDKRDGSMRPFKQVNDFLLNGKLLDDPGQSDVRQDAFWTTVKVGKNRRLELKPAPTAITPRVAFIQIYRAQP